jgi:hypothetical protein
MGRIQNHSASDAISVAHAVVDEHLNYLEDFVVRTNDIDVLGNLLRRLADIKELMVCQRDYATGTSHTQSMAQALERVQRLQVLARPVVSKEIVQEVFSQIKAFRF